MSVGESSVGRNSRRRQRWSGRLLVARVLTRPKSGHGLTVVMESQTRQLCGERHTVSPHGPLHLTILHYINTSCHVMTRYSLNATNICPSCSVSHTTNVQRTTCRDNGPSHNIYIYSTRWWNHLDKVAHLLQE